MTATPDLWLLPDRLFDGSTLRADMALRVKGAHSTDLHPVDRLPRGAQVLSLRGTLTPGFLDLQVNGGGDALVNADPSPAGLRTIAAAHRRFGTVGILPTVITDAPEVMVRAVDAALAVRGEPGQLGLHIEGPHIAPARRGTHAAEWVRPFQPATLAQIRRLRDAGIFTMITLAPEAASPADVAQIVATGAVVSIGHSDATAEEAAALLQAGASAFTHLYNAMSPMLGRAPGVTGAAITSTAYAGIIVDGVHVADEMVGLAIRARPCPGRMLLVSDAMATVGGSASFRLYGQEIRLQDGRLVNAEGALAGAHVTMAKGLQRLITRVGVTAETALDMAIAAPARLLGRPDLASPEQRPLSDLVLLGADWKVTAQGADLLSAGD